MKKILIISVVLAFNTTSYAIPGQSQGYKTYGSGIGDGCSDSFGVPEAEIEAEARALEMAKKRCDYYFGSEVTEKALTIIDSHRGGCWSGIPAEAHVKLAYFCN